MKTGISLETGSPTKKQKKDKKQKEVNNTKDGTVDVENKKHTKENAIDQKKKNAKEKGARDEKGREDMYQRGSQYHNDYSG